MFLIECWRVLVLQNLDFRLKIFDIGGKFGRHDNRGSGGDGASQDENYAVDANYANFGKTNSYRKGENIWREKERRQAGLKFLNLVFEIGFELIMFNKKKLRNN